jgi:hypothetical protein
MITQISAIDKSIHPIYWTQEKKQWCPRCRRFKLCIDFKHWKCPDLPLCSVLHEDPYVQNNLLLLENYGEDLEVPDPTKEPIVISPTIVTSIPIKNDLIEVNRNRRVKIDRRGQRRQDEESFKPSETMAKIGYNTILVCFQVPRGFAWENFTEEYDIAHLSAHYAPEEALKAAERHIWMMEREEMKQGGVLGQSRFILNTKNIINAEDAEVFWQHNRIMLPKMQKAR